MQARWADLQHSAIIAMLNALCRGRSKKSLDALEQTAHLSSRWKNALEQPLHGMLRGSEAFQKHIYESFSRAENSVTNKVQGTGLGMAITKNIVDMMGGVITLQSQLDKGTRFEVVLDFKICEETVQAAPTVCPAPAQDSPSLHGMRFLCSASATNRLRSSRNNRQHKSPAAENQAAGLSVCSPVRQGPAGSLQSRTG